MISMTMNGKEDAIAVNISSKETISVKLTSLLKLVIAVVERFPWKLVFNKTPATLTFLSSRVAPKMNTLPGHDRSVYSHSLRTFLCHCHHHNGIESISIYKKYCLAYFTVIDQLLAKSNNNITDAAKRI